MNLDRHLFLLTQTYQTVEQISDLPDPQEMLQTAAFLLGSYSILPMTPAIYDHTILIYYTKILNRML